MYLVPFFLIAYFGGQYSPPCLLCCGSGRSNNTPACMLVSTTRYLLLFMSSAIQTFFVVQKFSSPSLIIFWNPEVGTVPTYLILVERICSKFVEKLLPKFVNRAKSLNFQK